MLIFIYAFVKCSHTTPFLRNHHRKATDTYRTNDFYEKKKKKERSNSIYKSLSTEI